MKDDYLWDRSGEPDPEVQQLEEILGTLRYQPGALKIPADLKIDRRGNFFRRMHPALAIAAAIAIVLFGSALWFGLQRLRNNSQPQVAQAPPVNPETTPAPAPKVKEPGLNPDYKEASVATIKRRPQSFAGNRNRVRREPVINATENPKTAANRQEAQAAKDQLFLALRLASTKLKFAQRKAQNSNSQDLIHNQHRIG